MEITVCVGSSCYLKGSKDIVSTLERLVAANGLQGKVTLKGSFCMGNCTHGVSVKVDDALHSLSPSTTEAFFNDVVLPALR